MSPLGQGDLAAAFEELKARLADEGLFDAEFKKPIPQFPRKIGIVTSADAAALRDIINVLRRRYPLVSVLIAPTLVQGADAPPQIVRALRWLDGRNDLDTIIIARGGGSMEDLWAFNDETGSPAPSLPPGIPSSAAWGMRLISPSPILWPIYAPRPLRQRPSWPYPTRPSWTLTWPAYGRPWPSRCAPSWLSTGRPSKPPPAACATSAPRADSTTTASDWIS
jgi:hypothetical protein